MNAREAIAEAIRYGGRAAAINKALFVIEGLRARGFTIMSKEDAEAVATVYRKGNVTGQLVWTKAGDHADLPDGTKLYTHPPESRLREALEWYAEQARLCRLIHSGGDAGRNALAKDGGAKARAALAQEDGRNE